MNALIRLVLSAYQVFISPLLKQTIGVRSSCRYYPSCSEFAKEALREHGILIGAYRSLLRILSCQPFFFNQFDRGAII